MQNYILDMDIPLIPYWYGPIISTQLTMRDIWKLINGIYSHDVKLNEFTNEYNENMSYSEIDLNSIKATEWTVISKEHYVITNIDEQFEIIYPKTNQMQLDPDELILTDSDKDELTCCICSYLLHDAKYMCNQNHSVCGKCSQKISECPLCREKYYLQRSNYEVISRIDNLIINCYECKDSHELAYPCQLLCKICDMIIRRRDKNKHVKLHTTYCGYCGVTCLRRELSYHHNHKCNGVIKCLTCYDEYKVCDHDNHKNTCLRGLIHFEFMFGNLFKYKYFIGNHKCQIVIPKRYHEMIPDYKIVSNPHLNKIIIIDTSHISFICALINKHVILLY